MRSATARSLPRVGDEFASLSAFEKATRAAQRELDADVELLLTKDSCDDHRTLVCQRGKRKPGRRKNNERRIEDHELCPFSISASLDSDRTSSVCIVESYKPHHHLDIQLYSSSPAQVQPQAQAEVPVPSSPIRTASASAPSRHRSAGGTSSSSRRDRHGRFISTSKTSQGTREPAEPVAAFEIPLLPVAKRRHPSPPRSSFIGASSTSALADTDEYIHWKRVLGLGAHETPRAWKEPVPQGRGLFALWGWSPQAELKQVNESPSQLSQIFAVSKEDTADLDYRDDEDMAIECSGYQRSVKRRRQSTAQPTHILAVRPSTRSELREASRRGSTSTDTQSPELRRAFWSPDERKDVTMTPETPMLSWMQEEESSGGQCEENATMALLDLSRDSGIGLGISCAADEHAREDSNGSGEESVVTVSCAPASLAVEPFPRSPTSLPFPFSYPHSQPSRSPLRVDTSLSSPIVASPQPMTGIDERQSESQAGLAVPTETSSALRRDDSSLIAAIESSLPPLSPSKLAPTPPWARASLPPLKSSEAGRAPSSTSLSHRSSSSPPKEEVQPSRSIALVPSSSSVPASRGTIDDEPVFGTLVFKPRRPKLSSRTNYATKKTAKPALEVALASAANASSSAAAPTSMREDIKPDVSGGVDLLQQREEVKQLQARFLLGSDSEIDPLYSSAGLEYKIASLRLRGITFTVNQAHANLLVAYRPLRSQLPQPFLHVSRDSLSRKLSPTSARPLDPRLVAAISYVWGRELGKGEMEWLEKNEPAIWTLLGEMVKVRTINEKFTELGLEDEAARDDLAGRGWSQQSTSRDRPHRHTFGKSQGNTG